VAQFPVYDQASLHLYRRIVFQEGSQGGRQAITTFCRTTKEGIEDNKKGLRGGKKDVAGRGEGVNIGKGRGTLNYAGRRSTRGGTKGNRPGYILKSAILFLRGSVV